MTDRKKLLREAIEDMADLHPLYFDEAVARQLTSNDALSVSILLGALIDIVDQCLKPRGKDCTEYDVDTTAMSTHQHAARALAQLDMLELVDPVRFGRWTPAGKEFRTNGMEAWKEWRDKISAHAEIGRNQDQLRWTNYVELARREHPRRWMKYAFVAAVVAAVCIVTSWIVISSF